MEGGHRIEGEAKRLAKPWIAVAGDVDPGGSSSGDESQRKVSGLAVSSSGRPIDEAAPGRASNAIGHGQRFFLIVRHEE